MDSSENDSISFELPFVFPKLHGLNHLASNHTSLPSFSHFYSFWLDSSSTKTNPHFGFFSKKA